jgi:hypothetical protein
VCSSDLASEIEACRKAGMDDHVPKPIEVAMLMDALTRWLPVLPNLDVALAAKYTSFRNSVSREDLKALSLLISIKPWLKNFVGEGRVCRLEEFIEQKNWEKAKEYTLYLAKALGAEI